MLSNAFSTSVDMVILFALGGLLSGRFHDLFIIATYYLFMVYGSGSDGLSFFSEICNLCLLIFNLVILTRDLSILLIYSENQLLVSLNFSIDLWVLILLISALFLFFFFLMFA